MSSSSGSGSGTRAPANASASIYFCHECNQRTAQLTDVGTRSCTQAYTEIKEIIAFSIFQSFTCPNCGSGFVELLEDGDPDEVLAGNEGDDWGQDEVREIQKETGQVNGFIMSRALLKLFPFKKSCNSALDRIWYVWMSNLRETQPRPVNFPLNNDAMQQLYMWDFRSR